MEELKQQRDFFGDALVKIGQVNSKVLALTADLESSLRLTGFKEKYPDRFFNVGVAEQNLIGTAVGLFLEGFIPFCASFAVFLPGRCFDQIRVSVCQNRANVKLVGGHLGFSNAGDGASAQAIEDIALMRSLPEMVILCPYDGEEVKELVNLAAEYEGPVYLRISKSEVPSNFKFQISNSKWKIGGARVLKKGKDLTILSHGPVLTEVLKAGENFDVEIIDAYSIKPLDKQTILKSAAKTGKVLIVEEHSIYGGIGSAVTELLAQEYPLPVKILGIPDVFGESARDWKQLLEKYGLDSQNISKVIRKLT